MGVPWELLGVPWELFDVLRNLLGVQWELLGGPWGFLGDHWKLLGAPWELLGARHENQEKNESEKASKYLTDKGSDAFLQITKIAKTERDWRFGRASGTPIWPYRGHSFLRFLGNVLRPKGPGPSMGEAPVIQCAPDPLAPLYIYNVYNIYIYIYIYIYIPF